MNTVETFKPHATEIRKRICDTVQSLGLALAALENCELSAAMDGAADDPAVSAILMQTHLEEMAGMLDSTGEYLTAANDLVSTVISRLSDIQGDSQAAATDDEADNGASYRVRGQGGAS